MVAHRQKGLWAAAVLAGLQCVANAATAETGDVVLRLKDSLIEVAGSLKSFDGDTYVVDARAFGILSLPASRFDCEGAQCVALARTAGAGAATVDFVTSGIAAAEVERFAIQGSDTLGRELMPALIRDYARSLGGSVRQVVGANPDAAQFKVHDARGALLSVIDVERAAPAVALGSVSRGSAAIAMSTRPIQPPEALALSRNAPRGTVSDLENVIALDGLAVIVPPESPARALSIDKLGGIFSGKIADWSEVGLPAGRINLYIGADSTGSSDAFNDLVLKPGKLTVAASASRLASEAEVSDAVARDPHGIGVTSYGLLRNAKPLALSSACGLGWSPSEFSIKAEEYPLGRRLYLYSSGAPAAAGAGKLLKFANSSSAQSTIAASQFMDQSVVSTAAAEHGDRVSGWLAQGQIGTFEKRLAGKLLDEIKDARRLSLTFRFAPGESRLDAKARQDITRLAELMQQTEYAGKTIMLLGFTDWVGTPESNAALAVRRASEVRAAVLAAAPAGKLDPRALAVQGYGAVAPVACNDGNEGMNRNRRVEVWVSDRARSVVAEASPPPATRVQYRKKRRPR